MKNDTPDDQIEVYVAARDLPVGTSFPKGELTGLVTKKLVSKDSLPPASITDEAEFFNKRLVRATKKDDLIDPRALAKGRALGEAGIQLPDGLDVFSVALSSQRMGLAAPGKKVDVLATARFRNGKETAFPLLVDMTVLAIDTQGDDATSMSIVSFAGTQQQALALALAKQRGCKIEFLISRPSAEYDIKRVLKVLADLPEPGTVTVTAEEEPPIAPELSVPKLKENAIVLPNGTELVSIAVVPDNIIGLIPGSKVDLITAIRRPDKKLTAMVLLSNVLIVAIDVKMEADAARTQTTTVSLAVDKDQAKVIALAQARGCYSQLAPRHPGKPVDADFDVKKVITFLKQLPDQRPATVAPAPRGKAGE